MTGRVRFTTQLRTLAREGVSQKLRNPHRPQQFWNAAMRVTLKDSPSSEGGGPHPPVHAERHGATAGALPRVNRPSTPLEPRT